MGRVGCWVSSGVKSRTTVVLMRIRHQLVSQNRARTKTLLVEEANALAWVGLAGAPIMGLASSGTVSLCVSAAIIDSKVAPRPRAIA